MTGADQRKPLWAGSLADQARPEYDDVIVRVLDEPEEPAPPPRHREPRGRPRLAPWAAAALAVAGIAIALDGPEALTVEDVPSYWGDVPMTCHTTRLERDERAVEWFTCRAVGGRSLPTGLYRSPYSQWTSDITGRDAVASRVRISPDGHVAGWATY